MATDVLNARSSPQTPCGVWRASSFSQFFGVSRLVLGVAAISFLLPFWLERYVPTQDGQALVANALILKDYGSPGTRFDEIYVLSWQPFPNWTSFALIAAFCSFLPPLVAEKLLVTIYVVGFLAAYRYFLGSRSSASNWLTLAGFLLVLNHCFWLGFYNFCLSLVLYWFIVGYFIRGVGRLTSLHAVFLTVLFLVCYFTHLVGFLFSAASCLWIALLLSPRPLRICGVVALALAPTFLLALYFFWAADYLSSEGFGRLFVADTRVGTWQKFEFDLDAIPEMLFPKAAEGPLDVRPGILALYGLFFATSLMGGVTSHRSPSTPWLIALGFIFAFFYFLLPNHFSFRKGGFLQNRLMLLPPLLWLSCCREPSVAVIRWGLRAATVGLLALKLVGVFTFVGAQNRDYAEFTAGIQAAGRNQVIFTQRDPTMARFDPFAHVTSYYCMGSGNIDLNNLFAPTKHSPVRFRPGIEAPYCPTPVDPTKMDDGPAGFLTFDEYPNRALVDVVIVWDRNTGPFTDRLPEFAIAFERGRLRIMKRITR